MPSNLRVKRNRLLKMRARPTSVQIVSANTIERKRVPPLNLKQLFDDTAKNATKRRTMKPWHPD